MCGGVMCPQEQVSVFLARKEKRKKKAIKIAGWV